MIDVRELIEQSKRLSEREKELKDKYSESVLLGNKDDEQYTSYLLQGITNERTKRNVTLQLDQNTDEQKDIIYDAIQNNGENMPMDYTSIIIDSYYEASQGEIRTIVGVASPSGSVYFIEVNTDSLIEIGKVFTGMKSNQE